MNNTIISPSLSKPSVYGCTVTGTSLDVPGFEDILITSVLCIDLLSNDKTFIEAMTLPVFSVHSAAGIVIEVMCFLSGHVLILLAGFY